MTTQEMIRPGDFTQLASAYAHHRPSYSETVLRAMLGIINKPVHELNFVDVGAGTGIWTRQVAKQGCKTIFAVEPNDAMRLAGQAQNQHLAIQWQTGAAENIDLPDQSMDFLTMASSFHWANFEHATQEFARILRPHGFFAALWNPRFFENDPLLLEIEQYIYQLAPDMQRVSSGKSKHVDALMDKLKQCPLFEDMVYLEGTHVHTLKPQEYIGAWRSVNDVQAQLGADRFAQFMAFVADKVKDVPHLHCYYKTRAWIVKKRS